MGVVDGGGNLEEEFFAPDGMGGYAADAIAVGESGGAKVEAALEAMLTDAASNASVAEADIIVSVGDTLVDAYNWGGSAYFSISTTSGPTCWTIPTPVWPEV